MPPRRVRRTGGVLTAGRPPPLPLAEVGGRHPLREVSVVSLDAGAGIAWAWMIPTCRGLEFLSRPPSLPRPTCFQSRFSTRSHRMYTQLQTLSCLLIPDHPNSRPKTRARRAITSRSRSPNLGRSLHGHETGTSPTARTWPMPGRCGSAMQSEDANGAVPGSGVPGPSGDFARSALAQHQARHKKNCEHDHQRPEPERCGPSPSLAAWFEKPHRVAIPRSSIVQAFRSSPPTPELASYLRIQERELEAR